MDSILTIAIAENYYGIPREIIDSIKPFTPEEYMELVNSFYQAKTNKNVCKRIGMKR